MSRHQIYFLKQKLMGVALLLLTILVVIALDGNMTIAIVTVPLGLVLLFSKTMLITDDYYFEVKERSERR